MGNFRIGYFEDRRDPESICSRCHLCELMCAFHHYGVGNPKRGRIRVVSLGRGVDIPITCLNCEDPPCMNICPTGALFRPNPDSMVRVHEDTCIGCSMCVNACPAGAIKVDPFKEVAAKCDLCDGDPQCAKYCPAGVLRLTDADLFVRHRMRQFAHSLHKADEES
jgi:carbon-monoxide dehydrogenase iron sulfur subunit